MFRFLLQTFVVVLLTILTQIGGLLWLLSYWVAGQWKTKRAGRAMLMFLPLYLLVTVLVMPIVAAYSGRTPLPVFAPAYIKPVNLFYPLFNRHYVTPSTKMTLLEVARQLHQHDPNAELKYLDAGFPLFEAFPLLPHLSHNDGRKVDLSFFYTQEDGTATNEKPSRSGYGVFEGPQPGEKATAEECHGKGHWQYSYPQYLSMGSRSSLTFDARRTKMLLEILLKQEEIGKIFLEPHLKQRLGLSAAKGIAFHGCGAVRHDDHIHMQMQDR